MATDLHYLSLDEVARRLKAREVSSVEATGAMLERIDQDRSQAHELRHGDARAGARRRPAPRCRDRRRPLARPAARRADRGEGSLRYRRRADRRRHGHSRQARAGQGCHRRGAAEAGGRGDPGQAADDRGRLRGAPSQGRAAAQSLERRVLDRGIVVGLGRGDRGRPLLRLAGLRHRRIDPLPVDHERPFRPQADLGPRQPRRRLSACRIARPCRADVPQRARCRPDAGRDRRRRSRRSDGLAAARARLRRLDRRPA